MAFPGKVISSQPEQLSFVKQRMHVLYFKVPHIALFLMRIHPEQMSTLPTHNYFTELFPTLAFLRLALSFSENTVQSKPKVATESNRVELLMSQFLTSRNGDTDLHLQ